MSSRIGVWVLGILGVAVLALGIAVVTLTQMDLRPHFESLATAKLGRRVTIGGLSIGWGNPIRIELTRLQLANPDWGSTPDMVTADRLGADIALWPLLHGALSLSHVVMDNPVIVLERDPNGTGNWVFRESAPSPADDASRPKPLPVQLITDLRLQSGELTFRTTKQHLLRVHIGIATLQAADETAPMILHAEGAYNDLPLVIDTKFESFAALDRVPRPVPTDITVAAKHSTIHFQGTMTDPIGFDGIAGGIELAAATTQDLAEAFGAAGIENTKLDLKGTLNKQGNSWRLTGLAGQLAGEALTGSFGLDEGKRGQPDHYDIDLDFAKLDLQRLTGAPSKDKSKGTSLSVAEHPDETYKIRIGAKQAVYGRYRMDALGVAGSLEPGKVTLEKLSFGFAEGRAEMSGTNEAAGAAGHLRLNASLSQGNAARLLAMAGSDTATLAGRLNAGVTLEMTGKTTEDGLTNSRGQAVLSMTGGQITRQFLELASIDVRLLLRKGQGFASVICLLAVADMRNGVASIAPMRLRTREGNLSGGGQIDLRRSYMDLYLQSEGKSTQFWALDIPVHITGSFSNPSVKPMLLSRMPAWSSENLRSLPPALRQITDRNC